MVKATYKQENKAAFLQGMKNGAPIGLGYLAVSFSLGIAAAGAGLTVFQAALASLLCNASAGEYAGFSLIASGAAYLEVALMTFIVNARYILMSCTMSQRMRPGERLGHRLLIGFDLTDELFSIAIARNGYVNPFYSYGAMAVSIPMWAAGTALGALAGNLLPARLVSALGVALYGMFLAVIVPPARKNKVILGLIAVCFALSAAAAYLPFVSEISEGTRTIILTVVISAAVALLFPVKVENDGNESPEQAGNAENPCESGNGEGENAAEKAETDGVDKKPENKGGNYGR